MRIDGLNITFGNLSVFDNFSAEFADGKINCIMGPSGCGKTTLLNYIAGLYDSAPKSDVIGCIFQEPRLLGWMSVKQNLIIAMPDSYAKSEKSDTADSFLAAVGLEKFRYYYPRQLSGGMRQRASIARAFCVPCELLLMDEAFSGQDLRTKAELQELFLSLWGDSPKTVIAATHEFSEAWILAQRVTVLSAIPAQVRFQKDITTPLAVRREFSDGSEAKLLRESVINAFATD